MLMLRMGAALLVVLSLILYMYIGPAPSRCGRMPLGQPLGAGLVNGFHLYIIMSLVALVVNAAASVTIIAVCECVRARARVSFSPSPLRWQ
jgi:hypothetical protein